MKISKLSLRIFEVGVSYLGRTQPIYFIFKYAIVK